MLIKREIGNKHCAPCANDIAGMIHLKVAGVKPLAYGAAFHQRVFKDLRIKRNVR